MHSWDLYRTTEGTDVRWAELVETRKSPARFLPERLSSEALLRADLVVRRLGTDEAEVIRATAPDGAPLDVVVLATGTEIMILLGAARPHSSGLVRLAFVYSALARSRDAVVFTDVSGAILGASTCWRELYGYPHQEILGLNPRLVNSRRHSQTFFRRLWLDLTDRNIGSWSGELQNRKRNGDRVTVWQTITTFYGADGSIAGYLGITRDLTARRELVARLTRSQRELDQTGRLIERLSADAAGDLRSPSHALVDHLELALGEASTEDLPELRNHLNNASRAAKHLLDMVERLIDPKGIRLTRGRVTPSRVFLRSIVRTEVELYSVLAARQGVGIRFREEGASFPSFIDEVRVSHALDNVLGGAVRRSHNGSTVEVVVRVRSDTMTQEVLIENEWSEVSNTPLVARIDRSSTESVDRSATARLMAIEEEIDLARHVVESHDGSIRAETTASGGCRVSISLPIEFSCFYERPWAVAVFDPRESLWAEASSVLRAHNIPAFIAQGEDELLHIFDHELPNLILHPATQSLPEACLSYAAPGGLQTLEPAICALESTPDGPQLRVASVSGPDELISQLLELLAPDQGSRRHVG